MNIRTDARYDTGLVAKASDAAEAGKLHTKLHFLCKVKAQMMKRFQFGRRESIFSMTLRHENREFPRWRRNIPHGSFVYMGAARYAAALGENQKKPRGGSRGAMTRSLSGR